MALAVSGGLQLRGYDGWVRQQGLAARDRELDHHVDLVALEPEDQALLVGEEHELALLRQWPAGLVPVLLVRNERDADPWPVLPELPRSGADERPLPVTVVVLGQDDGVVVVRARQVREVARRGVERELHGGRVDGLGTALGQHAGEDGQGVGAVRRIGEAVEGGHHVIGIHRLAVVERDAPAQIERPDGAVVVRRPALGEPRLELEVPVGPHQELAGLAEHSEASLRVHDHGVERSRWLRLTDTEGAALLRSTGLWGIGLLERVACGAAGRGDESRQRERHAGDGRATDELTPADLAEAQFVDQMVLAIRAPRPDRIDALWGPLHGLPSCAGRRPQDLPRRAY